MALSEEQPNTADGALLTVLLMVLIIVGTCLFAGQVVWAHDQISQGCIQNGRIWQAETCLLYWN